MACCSGIGHALASRLLHSDPTLRVCLGCRNATRGRAACQSLEKSFPQSKIDLLIIDVSSPSSVVSASDVIKTR